MIAIEFDRPKMRGYLMKSLALFFGWVVIPALAWGALQSRVSPRGWLHWLALLLFVLMAVHGVEFVQYLGVLVRGSTKRMPAVVINHAGILDNSSYFALGQLTWNEIQEMYPYEAKSRMLTNWWTKMPVISRVRGVMIILKDSADLRHLIENRPHWIRALSAKWYRPCKGRWLFIPEMVLPVTADELMGQINRFYVAEVRGY